MTKPLWIFCFGLFSWIGVSQAQIVISCRFRGVFHVEKVSRYNLVYEDARKTCSELDAVIATKEQVDIAHQIGFETCRYGWVDNATAVIPRTTRNQLCAAGYIGVYVLHTNMTSRYDVYCFTASETSEKNCEQYDYQNKSVPSYDPTEEGQVNDVNDSTSSKVSPTHPGHDISSSLSEQGGPVEDSTLEPVMSTDQPEHSGDHLNTQEEEEEEEGNTISPNLGTGDNEIDNTNEGFIEVLDRSEDNGEVTDSTIQRETGSFNDGIHLLEHDQDVSDTDSDATETPLGSAEENSGSAKNKHRRRAAVPEWLIVCVSLVCLGLIFSVCIALNARRLCGQKKKLVINGNGNKSSLEDGVIMEQNGDTVKSQEMVQLVSRDQTNDLGESDALTQDDIRNTKDVDMKIGV
ncbi:CD44 antigen isoform X1 [Phyllobates terribilis]|uniref:CD44 antigen isoform X1 n=1 Tax=Phyllobates terribilis TaxID=111132 RepID=UPI003CCA7DFE